MVKAHVLVYTIILNNIPIIFVFPWYEQGLGMECA